MNILQIIILILAVIIVIGSIIGKLSDKKQREYIKKEVFEQFDIVSTDLLDIIDLVIVESVKHIDEFKSLDEFYEYILFSSRNNIANYIKKESDNIIPKIKEKYAFLIDEDLHIETSIISEYFDKLITDNKYLNIIESSYIKAKEDKEKEEANQVSDPAEVTDISKNIENFYK